MCWYVIQSCISNDEFTGELVTQYGFLLSHIGHHFQFLIEVGEIITSEGKRAIAHSNIHQ